MARKGTFDNELVPQGWFDEAVTPGGWFDPDAAASPVSVKVTWAEFEVPAAAAAGDQTLVQSSRFDNTNSFYTHSLAATITLPQSSRFDNTNSFYTHALSASITLPQTARFDNTNTFYTHTLTPGAVTLVQSSGSITPIPSTHTTWRRLSGWPSRRVTTTPTRSIRMLCRQA